MLNLKTSLAVLFFFSMALWAESEENDRADYIRSHYTKFEYSIPARDGIQLFTSVYTPNDRSQKYPILLLRTPYTVRPYGADQYKTALGPDASFEKEGFIFVFQDVRGRYRSGGTFEHMRPHVLKKANNRDIDESTDTYDTIEWLLSHLENHNGNVGQWGVSYPGFYTSAGAIDSHPALKAISPQAPIGDWFWDDWRRHGAFILNMSFDFLYSFTHSTDPIKNNMGPRFPYKTKDGYQFFLELGSLKNVKEKCFKDEVDYWDSLADHPNYDRFWQERNILPHLKNIKAAVMTVGGWYDTEDLYGPLQTYRSIEMNNPGIFNILVMGPWSHGGWNSSEGESLGDADFGFKTARYFHENIDLKFFKHFLKDDSGGFHIPEALVFETGSNRWREFESWIPSKVNKKNLYLQDSQRLSFKQPVSEGTVFDSYISDPQKPVPYTNEITIKTITHMTEDQRFAARRPDVLVFQTEPLETDTTLAGPMEANLFVSTSGTDSDWVVKLIDVYPSELPYNDNEKIDPRKGGQQLLVRGDVFRGRFRESYEHPKPFVPNQITPIAFQIPDILHTFQRDHRIMIQIQSTWFPFVDRNPQKYILNIFKANDDDFITVNNRIYHSPKYPSSISVSVLE